MHTRTQSQRNFCGPDSGIPSERRCQHNNFLKYFYGIALLGLLYMIISLIHHGEIIRIITKDIKALKQDVADTENSETRIYKLETVINNLKREQESIRKNLKNIVNTELIKFAADKTGKIDFALESSGGKIVQLTPGTENFDNVKSIFGIVLCEGSHGPRAMIQSEMYPGHCWALKGSKGGVIIKLLGKVKIEAVSLEHIPQNFSPTGDITSAPREFTIVALRGPTDKGHEFGCFHYDINGPAIQMFDIKNTNYYEYVQFKVLSNHNNPDYTCVYRLRVHGTLEKY